MTTTAPVPSAAPLIVATQQQQQQQQRQQQQQHPPANLCTVKGLAIAQLCIGIASAILGLAMIVSPHENHFFSLNGAGIWAGGWMILAGCFGLRHAKNGRKLSCTYMALSIVSACLSSIAALFTAIGISYFVYRINEMNDDGDKIIRANANIRYDGEKIHASGTISYGQNRKYARLGLGFNIPLLILLVGELIMSIVAAAFCCKNNGCQCGEQQPGAVNHHQLYMPLSPPGVPTMAYASAGYPSNPQCTMQMAPQSQYLPQYGHHVQASQPCTQTGDMKAPFMEQGQQTNVNDANN